jgi:hypothetical protein
MLKNILKFSALAAAALFMSGPLRADIDIPVPHLEMHHIRVAPPQVRVEQRSTAPGSDYVWIGGYWDWVGDQWTWVPGRWDRPAERSVIWVNPRYEREDEGYRYEPGHWSNQRVVEGRDYTVWREKHHGHHKDKAKDHDDDHDHDHRL